MENGKNLNSCFARAIFQLAMPSHAKKSNNKQPVGISTSQIHKTSKEKSMEMKSFRGDIGKFGIFL
jgi:hypothetical protein